MLARVVSEQIPDANDQRFIRLVEKIHSAAGELITAGGFPGHSEEKSNLVRAMLPSGLRKALGRIKNKLYRFVPLGDAQLGDARANIGCVIEILGSCTPVRLAQAYETLSGYVLPRLRLTSDSLLLAVSGGTSGWSPAPSIAAGLPTPLDLGGDLWSYEFAGDEKSRIPEESVWSELNDVFVHSSGLVHDLEFGYFLEAALHPRNYYFQSIGEYFSVRPETNEFVTRCNHSEPAPLVLDEAVFLNSRASANWYHWWVEVMPRALRVPMSFGPEIPIVLCGPVPATFLDILRAFVPNGVVILDESTPFAQIRTIHTRKVPIETVDSFSPDYRNVVVSVNFSDLDFLRESITDKFGVAESDDRPGIFLVRSSTHRNLKNQTELVKVARELDLAPVEPVGMTWQDQIRLFQRSNFVVGPGGAVMGSYLFSNPGTTILQLVAKQNVAFVVPAMLAERSASQLFSLAGRSQRPELFSSALHWQHSAYEVDPKVFRNRLGELLAK